MPLRLSKSLFSKAAGFVIIVACACLLVLFKTFLNTFCSGRVWDRRARCLYVLLEFSMKKLRICFLGCFLSLACIASAFGQTSDTKTVKEPTPPDPSAIAVSKKDAEENKYRIGFQDLLDIQVYRVPELNQTVAVGPQGTVALFRLGSVVAVCKTANELANDIAKAYTEARYLKDPQIYVMVREQKSQSFAVIGAVEKPGNYYISRRVHLLELLAYAGGPNKESGTRLLVARAGSNANCKEASAANEDENIEVMDFKVRDVQEGKQTLWMKPGDVVSVLDADIVYVYGNVNKQGALKVREPITLTQALASAEGLKSNAKRGKIRVLRQAAGKADRDEFVFDLGQIDQGKAKDPFLEPNDIVAVSEDKVKTILHGITDTIRNSVPTAAYRF